MNTSNILFSIGMLILGIGVIASIISMATQSSIVVAAIGFLIGSLLLYIHKYITTENALKNGYQYILIGTFGIISLLYAYDIGNQLALTIVGIVILISMVVDMFSDDFDKKDE